MRRVWSEPRPSGSKHSRTPWWSRLRYELFENALIGGLYLLGLVSGRWLIGVMNRSWQRMTEPDRAVA